MRPLLDLQTSRRLCWELSILVALSWAEAMVGLGLGSLLLGALGLITLFGAGYALLQILQATRMLEARALAAERQAIYTRLLKEIEQARKGAP